MSAQILRQVQFKGCVLTDNSNTEEAGIIILRFTDVLKNKAHHNLEKGRRPIAYAIAQNTLQYITEAICSAAGNILGIKPRQKV